MTYMPDEIILARMMTTQAWNSKEFYITMMKGIRVTMTMGSDPRSQGLSAYTMCLL